MPPNAEDESNRQLIVNRLGVWGKKAFDSSDEGVAKAQKRTELAEKLEEQGQAPQTLKAWEPTSSGTSPETSANAELAMIKGVGEPVPETLEQHPVFRNIVRQCREMFGASISMLSVSGYNFCGFQSPPPDN